MTVLASPLAIVAALDGIGFLIFFLVAFISWLINFLSPKQPGKLNPGQRPGQKLDQRGKQIQTELEKFLQQTREIAEQRAKDNSPRDSGVEVVSMPKEDGNRRAPPPGQQRRVAQPAPQRPGSSREKPRQNLPSSKKPSQRLSSSERLQQKPESNISKRHIQTSVDSNPGRKLGNLTSTLHPEGMQTSGLAADSRLTGSDTQHAPMLQSTARKSNEETISHRATKASEMALLMRSPGQVRNAIIVNEILSRPIALRKSR